jgi:hypothetical protein
LEAQVKSVEEEVSELNSESSLINKNTKSLERMKEAKASTNSKK